MKEVLLALLTFALLGAMIAMLYHEWLYQRKLRLRVKKLYASQLFEDLIPLLKIAKKRHIEQIIVDKTGVVIRYLQPVGQESAFLMRPNGYHYLTPDQQEALRAALEECLPKLKDRERYHLSRKRTRLINGDVEYAHRYIMANEYKCRLQRAPYYDGSLQTRLW